MEQGLATAARGAAYRADVTYVTAREGLSITLRDRLCVSTEGVVHRPFHMALVDGADSLMIDEARGAALSSRAGGKAESRAPRTAEARGLAPAGRPLTSTRDVRADRGGHRAC